MSLTKLKSPLEYSSLFEVKSSQKAKLFALSRACKLAKEQRVNIYTNSKYAFGIVPDFGMLWKNKGGISSLLQHPPK